MPAHIGPHHGLHYGYTTGEDGFGDNLTSDLKRIDALLTASVKNRITNTPPVSPSDGDRYIVGPSPAGGSAWAGKAGYLAVYDSLGGSWLLYQPKRGWQTFCEAEGFVVRYNGTTWVATAVINALDFADLQDAIDSASVGMKVRIPAGTYGPTSVPSFTGISIPAGVTVEGDGPGSTYLTFAGGSTSANLVEMAGDNARLRGVALTGPGASGSGCGILVNPASANPMMFGTIEDVVISATASWGLQLNPVCVKITCRDLVISDAKSGGSVYIAGGSGNLGSTTCRFTDCEFAGPSWGTYGVGAMDRGTVHIKNGISISFFGCLFESAIADSVGLSIEGLCFGIYLGGATYFETHFTTGTKYRITQSGQVVQLVLDKIYCYSLQTVGPRLLKTDNIAGECHCTIRDAIIVSFETSPAADDISLNATYDYVNEQNSEINNGNTGIGRRFRYATGGSFAGKVMRQASGLRAYLTEANRGAPFTIPPDTNAHIAAWTNPQPGDMAVDTTNNKLMFYVGGAWRTVTSS